MPATPAARIRSARQRSSSTRPKPSWNTRFTGVPSSTSAAATPSSGLPLGPEARLETQLEQRPRGLEGRADGLGVGHVHLVGHQHRVGGGHDLRLERRTVRVRERLHAPIEQRSGGQGGEVEPRRPPGAPGAAAGVRGGRANQERASSTDGMPRIRQPSRAPAQRGLLQLGGEVPGQRREQPAGLERILGVQVVEDAAERRVLGPGGEELDHELSVRRALGAVAVDLGVGILPEVVEHQGIAKDEEEDLPVHPRQLPPPPGRRLGILLRAAAGGAEPDQRALRVELVPPPGVQVEKRLNCSSEASGTSGAASAIPISRIVK